MRLQIKSVCFLTIAIVSLSIAAARLAAQYPQPQPDRVYAIKAGKLVDPEKGTTETNQIILVRGKKIEAVGANVSIPADAKIIDLTKSTVLPGLFDAHTHLCMTLKKDRDGNNYFFTTLMDSTPYRVIEGVANARDMLAAGFTTVRDVGNNGNYGDTALREAIERGLVPGPTMINAGRIIAPYGGQFHLQPEKRDLATPEYAFADTHDEMIKAIRENIHYGATVIKIVVDDQKYIYSADDIRFMVEEAHRDGLKLAAHCWTRAGAHNAAEAGVDSIEHGEMMTNEDLQLAKKNHVVLVGTDFTERAARDSGFPELACGVCRPTEARVSDRGHDGVRHGCVCVRAGGNARDAGGGICRLLGRSGRARERHAARHDDQRGAPARRGRRARRDQARPRRRHYCHSGKSAGQYSSRAQSIVRHERRQRF